MTNEEMNAIIGVFETATWMIVVFSVVIPIRNALVRYLDRKADAERARERAADVAAETFRKARL